MKTKSLFFASLVVTSLASAVTVKRLTIQSHGHDNAKVEVEEIAGKIVARITECWKEPVKDIRVPTSALTDKEVRAVLANQAVIASNVTPRAGEFGTSQFPTLTLHGFGFDEIDETKPTSTDEIKLPMINVGGRNVNMIQEIHMEAMDICRGLMKNRDAKKPPEH